MPSITLPNGATFTGTATECAEFTSASNETVVVKATKAEPKPEPKPEVRVRYTTAKAVERNIVRKARGERIPQWFLRGMTFTEMGALSQVAVGDTYNHPHRFKNGPVQIVMVEKMTEAKRLNESKRSNVEVPQVGQGGALRSLARDTQPGTTYNLAKLAEVFGINKSTIYLLGDTCKRQPAWVKAEGMSFSISKGLLTRNS